MDAKENLKSTIAHTEERMEWVRSLLNRHALVSHNHVVTRDGLFIEIETKDKVVVGHSLHTNPYECSHLVKEDAIAVAASIQNGNGYFEAVHINTACEKWLKDSEENLKAWKEWLK